jgi:putative membrane protein insertion efficiency factor
MPLIRYIIAIPETLLVIGVRVFRVIRPRSMLGQCEFKPTCSEYAIGALQKHGAIEGLRLAWARLRRCKGDSASTGFDPVP